MDVERFAIEKEYAERIRQAASAIRHVRFE
jgi:hypothetical protein